MHSHIGKVNFKTGDSLEFRMKDNMEINSRGISDCGLKRGMNQDAIRVLQKGRSGLFLVADGMGGHQHGERASRYLAQAYQNWWTQVFLPGSNQEFNRLMMSLKEVLYQAHEYIRNTTPAGEVCGSTIVLILIHNGYYGIISVGDSRIYQSKGFRLRQLTSDDVWENLPQTVQAFSAKEIKAHMNYGKLVQAVGVGEQISCHARTDQLKKKQIFLLCSDGIYKYCPERFLEKEMRTALRTGQLNESMERIRKKVYDNSAPDNLSAVMIRIE